ncbi:unnamed protein product [Choristocarpus tenellus]
MFVCCLCGTEFYWLSVTCRRPHWSKGSCWYIVHYYPPNSSMICSPGETTRPMFRDILVGQHLFVVFSSTLFPSIDYTVRVFFSLVHPGLNASQVCTKPCGFSRTKSGSREKSRQWQSLCHFPHLWSSTYIFSFPLLDCGWGLLLQTQYCG